MRIKYVICFSFIMLLILISGVSANDNINHVSNSNVDLLSAGITDDVINTFDYEENSITGHSWYVNASADDIGYGSKDYPYNNLKIALHIANDGDTIYIAGGKPYSGENNVGLQIDRQINLAKYGDEEPIFDGEGTSRIFLISASSININGLTFQNAKSDEKGGALFFYDTISNSNINATYINNTADQGGANFFKKVINSNITGIYINNTAYEGGANHFFREVLNSNISGTYTNNNAKCRGAANYFNDYVLNSNITGSYTNNQARESGGANLFWEYVLNSNVSGTYVNNTAYDGVTCHFLRDVTNTNITGLFINNTAYRCAIITFSSTTSNVNISNAILLNNKYENDVGAIFAKNKGVIADNNWFGNNLTNYNEMPNIDSNVKMNKWLFLDGIRNPNVIKFFFMSYDEMTKESKVYNNSLFSIVNLTLSAINTSIDKNYVLINEEISYTFSTNASITAQIENSKYIIDIIGAFDSLQDLIKNAAENSVIKLQHNYVYNELDNTTEGVLIDKNITIVGNGFTIDAKGKSRIFDVIAGSINITDVKLINGNAYAGGAISFNNAISNSFLNATFINNTSITEGGAICFYDEVSNSIICGTYINNKGLWNGGANRFDSVKNSKISGKYINNKGLWNGGANYFYSEVINSDLSGTYINNNASNGGANYFCYNVFDTKISGKYINNTASSGALITFCFTTSNVNITNAIFMNNTYLNSSGLIYAAETGVSANNNWFENNVTNYESLPKNTNIKINSWLVLNGIGAHYKFKFLLMHYDNITKEITNYDNTLLPAINLKLSSINTTIGKNQALLSEEVSYDCLRNISITAQVGNVKSTIQIGIGDFDLLQELIKNVPENSVINLERNYSYNNFDGMTEGILINRNITINGNGFTIDAEGKTRIFNVFAESVNISNITLKNGHADKGSAIYFNNSIINSIINATFINNTFSSSEFNQGGVNYFSGEVFNSTISGTYIDNEGVFGNSINYYNTVKNSNIGGTYINNYVKSFSGGINYFGNVINSNISGTYVNNTINYGGINFFDNVVSDTNISGTYINNDARNSAIIYFDGNPKNVSIRNAIFLNNKYSYIGEIYAINGGINTYNNWFENQIDKHDTKTKKNN